MRPHKEGLQIGAKDIQSIHLGWSEMMIQVSSLGFHFELRMASPSKNMESLKISFGLFILDICNWHGRFSTV